MIHLFIQAQIRDHGLSNHTTRSTLPMSQTSANRYLTGIGQDQVRCTSSLKLTWIHKSTNKLVSTSPFEAERRLVLQHMPMRITQVPMVAY